MGLGRNMLSRTLEDCGTLWAVMFRGRAAALTRWVFWECIRSHTSHLRSFNLLNPILAAILAFLGRNIFWADGAYTNIFGKTTMRKPAAAPADKHELAVKNLEAMRAAGRAPKAQA